MDDFNDPPWHNKLNSEVVTGYYSKEGLPIDLFLSHRGRVVMKCTCRSCCSFVWPTLGLFFTAVTAILIKEEDPETDLYLFDLKVTL